MIVEIAMVISYILGVGKLILGISLFIFMIKVLNSLKEIKEELKKQANDTSNHK